MGFEATVAQDFSVSDGYETVTVTNKTLAGNTTTSCPFATRFDIDRREQMASAGAFTSQSAIWHIPVATVATMREADTITDAAGVVWTVTDAKKIAWDSLWECITTKER